MSVFADQPTVHSGGVASGGAANNGATPSNFGLLPIEKIIDNFS